MTIEDVPDSVRAYSPEEERVLTLHLLDLATAVDAGRFSEGPLSTRLIVEIHRELFADVRGHAGKIRERGFGSERLVFGPNSSAHRDEVPEKLERLFDVARRRLAALLDQNEDSGFEENAIALAGYVHAEVIRIHPFEDGNGRTSRVLMGIILVRAGLRQIPVESCKQEYLDCLNAYFATGELRALVDLLLRVDLGIGAS